MPVLYFDIDDCPTVEEIRYVFRDIPKHCDIPKKPRTRRPNRYEKSLKILSEHPALKKEEQESVRCIISASRVHKFENTLEETLLIHRLQRKMYKHRTELKKKASL